MLNEFLLLSFLFINLLIYFYRNQIIKIYGIYDYPDKKRKVHKQKTSLLGGFIFIYNLTFFSIILIIFGDILIKELIFFENINNYFLFYFTSICFYILGLYDDKRNLNANLKLFIISILILLIIFSDLNIVIKNINFSFSDKTISLAQFDFLFTLFCFVAFINAFNLYDGINLQNGIYTLFVFIFLLLITNINFFILFLFFPLLIFLILNSYGKIFLGNSGTYFLSFVISYLFIKTFNLYGSIFSDQILAIMLIPGLDMIRLFFLRIKLKQHPFTPDRNHIHHRFLEIFGFKKTIVIISCLSILPITLLIYFKSYFVIIFSIFLYFYIMFYIRGFSKSLK